MNELLLNTIIDKLTNIDDKVQQLGVNAPETPDYGGKMQEIGEAVADLKTKVSRIPDMVKFPEVPINRLLETIVENNELMKRPPVQQIRHHHHVTTPIIASGILFLLLVLSAAWLYNTHSMLDIYRAGDIKYRFVRLQVDKGIRRVTTSIDSMYRLNPQGFQEKVVTAEQDRERLAALMEEVQEKEREADQIRKKVEKSK